MWLPCPLRHICILNFPTGEEQAVTDDWRVKLALPVFLLVDLLLKQQRIARFLFDSFRSPKNIREVLLVGRLPPQLPTLTPPIS